LTVSHKGQVNGINPLGARRIYFSPRRKRRSLERSLAASKLEIRISKSSAGCLTAETNSNDKKLKFKTKYKLLIINKLQQTLSNIEQKEQEVEG
jgi:hypothetical protein